MKDKIVVIGGGGHGKVIISTIKKLENYEILGYTDLNDKGLVLGANYLGTDEVLSTVLGKNKNCKAVIGIGCVRISDKRLEIYKMLKETGFELPIIISKDAIVNEEVIIGEGTVIMEKAIVNVSSNVGKCVIINSGVIVEHDCMVGDFVHLAVGAIISGGVEVGDNSIIGLGANVLHSKRIGNNCLIGAGAVVIKDITQEGTYFGVPASRFNIANSFQPKLK